MDAFYKGEFDDAAKKIDHSPLKKQKRNRLLYLLNQGTLHFYANNPAESNRFFNDADLFLEDLDKERLKNATGYLLNPNIKTYHGESFEKVLIHYYKILNFLQLGQPEAALVECKRMQLRLQNNIDYFKQKCKYKDDAFVHLLTGMVYEMQADYNNAYIAYKNAVEIYQNQYNTNYGTLVPNQLKSDLIKMALLNGFTEEANKFMVDFNLTESQVLADTANVFLFWNNGLCPIKDEDQIMFTANAQTDFVYFKNKDLDIVIPYQLNHNDSNLRKLTFVRVVFPKYVSRVPVVTSGKITSDSFPIHQTFEEIQPVDHIAYTSLSDRMFKEISEAVIRAAFKQTAALSAGSKDDGLATALSLLAAVTEQADTRNWQTLPFNINYCKVALPAGNHRLNFNNSTEVNVSVKNNMPSFAIIQTPQFNGYKSR